MFSKRKKAVLIVNAIMIKHANTTNKYNEQNKRNVRILKDI